MTGELLAQTVELGISLGNGESTVFAPVIDVSKGYSLFVASFTTLPIDGADPTLRYGPVLIVIRGTTAGIEKKIYRGYMAMGSNMERIFRGIFDRISVSASYPTLNTGGSGASARLKATLMGMAT